MVDKMAASATKISRYNKSPTHPFNNSTLTKVTVAKAHTALKANDKIDKVLCIKEGSSASS
jgi:hypothetical protein